MIGIDHTGNKSLDVTAVCICGIHKIIEVIQEPLNIKLERTTDVDLLIFRLFETFLCHELLLVELLARTKARVFNLDIDIRFETGEADQVAREGVNLDRAAHVKDEDLAAAGVGARQKHEADSLGNRHEIADDVGVGNRDRTSLLDLLLEDRDDTAVGAEDVAETNGHKLGLNVAEEFGVGHQVKLLLAAASLRIVGKELRDLRCLALLDLRVKTLDDHLAQTLRSAHDVGGIDRLVSGDQHEALTAVNHGRVSGLVGTDGVVLDGLAGAVLHEWHMLVRRRVIHDVGLVLLEDLEHFPRVAHGTDEGYEIELRVLFLQLKLNAVGVVFVDVENDQALRMVVRHLTAELAADGSAAARHENGLAVQEIKDLIHVDLDRIAAEKVLDGNLFKIRYGDIAVDELVHAGQVFELAPGFLAYGKDVPALRHARGGNGEENFLNVVFFRCLENVLAAADYGHAVDVAALLVLVVVDDAYNTVTDLHCAVDVAYDHLTGRTGADDHDVGTLSLRLTDARLRLDHKDEAVRKTRAENEAELDDRADDVVGDRHSAHRERVEQKPHHRGDADRMNDRGDDRCYDGAQKFAVAREPPDTLIKTQQIEA